MQVKEVESQRMSFQVKKNNRLSFLHRRKEDDDEDEQIFVNLY